jgi:hypothetical protein
MAGACSAACCICRPRAACTAANEQVMQLGCRRSALAGCQLEMLLQLILKALQQLPVQRDRLVRLAPVL